MLEDARRLLKTGFEIAVFPQHVRLQVVRRNTFRQFRRVFIFAAVVVNQRRARFQSFDRIVDVRQLFILNIDQPNRLFCDRLTIGRHRRHRIAAHATLS